MGWYKIEPVFVDCWLVCLFLKKELKGILCQLRKERHRIKITESLKKGCWKPRGFSQKGLQCCFPLKLEKLAIPLAVVSLYAGTVLNKTRVSVNVNFTVLWDAHTLRATRAPRPVEGRAVWVKWLAGLPVLFKSLLFSLLCAYLQCCYNWIWAS